MMKIRPIIYLSLLLTALLVWACEDSKDADIEGVELELDFKRLDLGMTEAAKALKNNPKIESKELFESYFVADRDFYLNYLGIGGPEYERAGIAEEQYDSLMGLQLKEFLADSLMFQLLDTLNQIIPQDYPFAEKLSAPLKRLNQLFPDTQIPAIRTHANGYVSGIDLRGADQLSSIPGYISLGLHYFLGKDFPYYPENIYGYQRRRFNLDHLEVVFAKAIAEEFVARRNPAQKRKLIDGMIHAGIKQYFVRQLLPYTADSLRLYYTTEQMLWAEHFEEKIYSLLLDKFFDSDFKMHRNYLADKPYTTELSDDSAPRIGEYLGWKIVEKYMEDHPEVSLAELCDMQDYEGLFRAARYKP